MNSFSSSTRNQHPHHGLDPGMEKEKRRKKKRKPATSTSSSSTEQVSPPPPSLPPHHIVGPSWSEMHIFKYTSSTRVTGTIIKTARVVLYTSKLN